MGGVVSTIYVRELCFEFPVREIGFDLFVGCTFCKFFFTKVCYKLLVANFVTGCRCKLNSVS